MNFLDTIFTTLIHWVEGAVSSALAVGTYVLTGNPVASIAVGGTSQVFVEKLPPFADTMNGMLDTLTKCQDQACIDAVSNQIWWDKTYGLIAQFGWMAVVAVVALVVISWFIGWLMPNFKQMRYKKERNKMKDMMFDDPKVKMRDLK